MGEIPAKKSAAERAFEEQVQEAVGAQLAK